MGIQLIKLDISNWRIGKIQCRYRVINHLETLGDIYTKKILELTTSD